MFRLSMAGLLIAVFPTLNAQFTLLDPGFGQGGIVFRSLNALAGDQADDVLVQPDGRIVVAATRGGSNSHMVMMRLLDDGAPDNSFSGNGLATASVGVRSVARCLALQPDGRIIMAGNAEFAGSFDDLTFTRFTPDGELDTDFSGDGVVTITSAGAADAVLDLELLPDGRILGGGKFDGLVADLAAVRLLANGTLDAGFGENGIFRTTEHHGELAECIALRPDGKLLLGGAWHLALPDADLGMLQLKDDGTPDSTGFGVNGLFRPSEPGSTSVVRRMHLLQDGSAWIASKRYVQGSLEEEVFTGKVTSSGDWDLSYGLEGRFFLPPLWPRVGVLRDTEVLPNGKMLLTMDVQDTLSSETSILVTRLLPDGSADASFGVNGQVEIPCPFGGCSVRAIAVDQLNRIVAVGTHGTLDGPEVMVMRWLPELVPVSVPEAATTSVTVYPSPCTDRLTVMGAQMGAIAELVDMEGRSVAQLTREGDRSFALPSDVRNGVYVLRLRSGNAVRVGRVVVQR